MAERFTPESVRESCAEYSTPLVTIDADALNNFVATELASPSLCDISIEGTNAFPELRFRTADDEVAFVVLVHALDFGSGFRHALHKRRDGAGAWLTIRAGCVRLGHLSTDLQTSFLEKLDHRTVSQLFDIDNSEELSPLVAMIHSVFQDIAHGLARLKMDSLTSFIRSVLESSPTTTALVHALVSNFQHTFKDDYEMPQPSEAAMLRLTPGKATVNPHTLTVRLYKKAQLVASEVHTVLTRTKHMYNNQTSPGLLEFDKLTSLVDNVVVATLRKAKVLKCDPALESALERNRPLRKGSEEEVGLRATALVACERATELWNVAHPTGKRLTPAVLANFLWGHLGKRADYRCYPRHYTPDTLFY
jgi:hypothetical protein